MIWREADCNRVVKTRAVCVACRREHSLRPQYAQQEMVNILKRVLSEVRQTSGT
jgi:hypothetical protein